MNGAELPQSQQLDLPPRVPSPCNSYSSICSQPTIIVSLDPKDDDYRSDGWVDTNSSNPRRNSRLRMVQFSSHQEEYPLKKHSNSHQIAILLDRHSLFSSGQCDTLRAMDMAAGAIVRLPSVITPGKEDASYRTEAFCATFSSLKGVPGESIRLAMPEEKSGDRKRKLPQVNWWKFLSPSLSLSALKDSLLSNCEDRETGKPSVKALSSSITRLYHSPLPWDQEMKENSATKIICVVLSWWKMSSGDQKTLEKLQHDLRGEPGGGLHLVFLDVSGKSPWMWSWKDLYPLGKEDGAKVVKGKSSATTLLFPRKSSLEFCSVSCSGHSGEISCAWSLPSVLRWESVVETPSKHERGGDLSQFLLEQKPQEGFPKKILTYVNLFLCLKNMSLVFTSEADNFHYLLQPSSDSPGVAVLERHPSNLKFTSVSDKISFPGIWNIFPCLQYLHDSKTKQPQRELRSLLDRKFFELPQPPKYVLKGKLHVLNTKPIPEVVTSTPSITEAYQRCLKENRPTPTDFMKQYQLSVPSAAKSIVNSLSKVQQEVQDRSHPDEQLLRLINIQARVRLTIFSSCGYFPEEVEVVKKRKKRTRRKSKVSSSKSVMISIFSLVPFVLPPESPFVEFLNEVVYEPFYKSIPQMVQWIYEHFDLKLPQSSTITIPEEVLIQEEDPTPVKSNRTRPSPSIHAKSNLTRQSLSMDFVRRLPLPSIQEKKTTPPKPLPQNSEPATTPRPLFARSLSLTDKKGRYVGGHFSTRLSNLPSLFHEIPWIRRPSGKKLKRSHSQPVAPSVVMDTPEKHRGEIDLSPMKNQGKHPSMLAKEAARAFLPFPR